MKIAIGLGMSAGEAVLAAVLAQIEGFDPVFWGVLALGLSSATVIAHYLINERHPLPGGPLAA